MDQEKTVETKKGPRLLELGKGVYFWCQCGASRKQPFCDGSHKGSGMQPVKFQITEEKKKVALCLCKKTGKSPFCDGSHQRL